MLDQTKHVNHISIAKKAIQCELETIQALQQHIDHTFATACEHILACQGRVIVTGMGKSGHIARKIAATFASTGTPAFFVHPGEASHGDMGMITARDVVLALSASGATPEVMTLLPTIKYLNIPLIAMTCRARSPLAEAANTCLHVEVEKEACPLGLAPTSSTTAFLVMGDALAITLLQNKGFTPTDFARAHPGGTLGKRLLLTAKDLMHTHDKIPVVKNTSCLNKALVEMNNKRLGCVNIVDEEGRLLGIFTDGDLRRVLDQGVDIHSARMAQIMTKGCVTAAPHTLITELLPLMHRNRITVITISDIDNKPIGMVHMHDLIKTGITT